LSHDNLLTYDKKHKKMVSAEIERLRKEVAGQKAGATPAQVQQSAADEEVQRLKEQLKESQRMIEEMNLHWQEQLREQVRRIYV
jgi:hypothetical protein